MKSVNEKGNWLEVRRIFPLVAGILILISIFLPFWSVSMSAPQYPEKDLIIKIFANKMAGDVWEFNALNQYAGVKFPENIPEFRFLPAFLTGLGIFSVITAFTNLKLRKKLLLSLIIVLIVFLGASVADLAWRLYEVGHNLDPNAPMKGIPPFTPPILGENKVANFTTFSMLRSGGISIGLALILNIIGYVMKNSPVTITEWGSKLWNKLDD